jgi:predicted Rossmann fold nucleotide-binding protein DprA/Smf involved in DNA uptake
MAARRSKEEIIKELEAKIQKLKDRAQAEKEVKLTKHSAGIQEAIAAIEHVAAQHGIAVSDVIIAISKMKRTGLKIESPAKNS